MNISVAKSVNSDFDGYSAMIEIYYQTKQADFSDVEIDFSQNTWFDANLVAVLGAILTGVSERNNIILVNLNSRMEQLFESNHFLSYFGGRRLPDFYGTTVPYKKFRTVEARLFDQYLETELISRDNLPKMTEGLKRQIKRSIFEIFENARIHGGCNTVFTCGQWFPRDARLDFAVVDMGRTIRKNVREFLGDNNISGRAAIEWAVCEGHTTKMGPIPGGLGLSLIKEFLQKNKGKIQIVSSNGFWEQSGNDVKDACFGRPFWGTIVNLEFNIADKASYCLASETKEAEIF